LKAVAKKGIYEGRGYRDIPPLVQDTIVRLLALYERDPTVQELGGVARADLFFHERNGRTFTHHLNETIARGLVERILRPPLKWDFGGRPTYWYRLTDAGRAYVERTSSAEAVRARRTG
jgi:hypothetical protein